MINTKGIIFDLRHYPNWTIYEICRFLSVDKQPFATFVKPDYSYPGTFHCDPPTTCGRKRHRRYAGKIVILINEYTQSRGEFTAMALRTLPDAICIGSQTAGADGNVATLVFPGNCKVLMTSLGVYYPDGRQTQRIGLVPDIEIKPSIEGVRGQIDEVLERGIRYIETGK